jgi:NitT/TauT family transport system substrate-binding protein
LWSDVRLGPRTSVLLAIALLAAGCGGAAAQADGTERPVTVRLGYLPNLTHASAIVGVEEGIFAERLAPHRLDTRLFNAGPDVVTAMFAGAIDVAYVGPNPAINAYVRSDGAAIRIVAGATSGGASLVVRPGIDTVADVKGKKLATPQLGGTQDVALRAWLKRNGYRTDPQGGGDVSVVPQGNAETLETFRAGTIDGAWVPEPWATRLVQEGGGKVLVDERTLWPGGQFVTTNVIVRTGFLKAHPDAVRRLLEGHVAVNDLIARDPARAKAAVNTGIARATGKSLAPSVIDAAWGNLTFTNDPLATSLVLSARHAEELRLLKPGTLDGIHDLDLLNQVLAGAGLAEVAVP